MNKQIELPILKLEIRSRAEQLLCEVHPKCCELRDQDYPALEAMTLQVLSEPHEEIPSIQTAFATLEERMS